MFQSSTLILMGLLWSALHSELMLSVNGFQTGLRFLLITSVLCTTVHCPYSLDRLKVRKGSLLPKPKKSLAVRSLAFSLKERTSLFEMISSAVTVIVCFLLEADLPEPASRETGQLELWVSQSVFQKDRTKGKENNKRILLLYCNDVKTHHRSIHFFLSL